MFWPSTAVPALRSLVLIDGALVASLVKHLATSHLRVLIVAHITSDLIELELYDARQRSKHIAAHFASLDRAPLHAQRHCVGSPDAPTWSRSAFASRSRCSQPRSSFAYAECHGYQDRRL